MFSDRYRYVKTGCLFFTLLVLCLYSYKEGNRRNISLEKCLSDAATFDGKQIILEERVQVTNVLRDRFEISQDHHKIMVLGTAEGLAPYDVISLRAIFHKQGYLTVQELHIKKLRRLKMIISLCAALCVIGLFIKRYQLSLKKFCFMERTACRT